MKKNFFKSKLKHCLTFMLAIAVTMTQVSPYMTQITVEAAENDNEPYVISADRPSYASSYNGGDDASKAFDGDDTTRWQAAESDTGEWIYTDLGKKAKITKVYISWEAATASKYRVQFSDDEVE